MFDTVDMIEDAFTLGWTTLKRSGRSIEIKKIQKIFKKPVFAQTVILEVNKHLPLVPNMYVPDKYEVEKGFKNKHLNVYFVLLNMTIN